MNAITDIREQLGVKSPEQAVPYLNFLVYGEPGAGKTYLSGTAEDSPLTSPILFCDVEGGTVTLRRRKGIDVVRIRTFDEIVTVHNRLYEDNGAYYKTVIIDSLSELQKLDMKFVMDEEYNRRPDSTDVDVPSQRGYLKSGNRIRRVVQGFKDLPLHTICTCLLGTEQDEVNGGTNLFPALPGRLRGEIPGYFDVVGYLRAEQEGEGVIRYLQTEKTRRVVAKDRTASLGGLLAHPTVPLMWEMIHSEDDASAINGTKAKTKEKE